MKKLLETVNRHFEAGFIAYLWINSCVLAALVGRPYLGLTGLGTVLPFLILYVLKVKKAESPPMG